jgi:hypothetical protein
MRFTPSIFAQLLKAIDRRSFQAIVIVMPGMPTTSALPAGIIWWH